MHKPVPLSALGATFVASKSPLESIVVDVEDSPLSYVDSSVD